MRPEITNWFKKYVRNKKNVPSHFEAFETLAGYICEAQKNYNSKRLLVLKIMCDLMQVSRCSSVHGVIRER